MAIKGITKIELTDVNTGEVETVIEENMFTNYYKYLFTPRFYGDPRTAITPITGKNTYNAIDLFGGIMCFPEPLEEDADNYMLPNTYTASASNYAFSDFPKAQGSFNGINSTISEDKHSLTFEWDWTPEQGNGTIASLGLMPAVGAELTNGMNVTTATPLVVSTSPIPMRNHTYSVHFMIDGAEANAFANVGVCYVSTKKGYLIIAPVSTTNSGTGIFTISKFRLPNYMRYPIMDAALDYTMSSGASGFAFTMSTADALDKKTLYVTDKSYLGYGVSNDGYIYYIQNTSSRAGSQGGYIPVNGEFTVHKVNCDTMEISSFTLVNTTGVELAIKVPAYSTGYSFGVMGDYFIFTSNDGGAYALNYNNYTDSHDIKDINGEPITQGLFFGNNFGPTHNGKVLCTTNQFTARTDSPCGFIGTDFIYRYTRGTNGDWQITGGSGSHPASCDDNTVMVYTTRGANSVDIKFAPYLDGLLTINNLSNSVVKTADKSMKITYTLTETVEDGEK